jgi:FSR family fosmidomycin resistance protein-like MFS transporter
LTTNDSDRRLRAPVDRARVGLLAASHAVDDIYQGAVPALPPFFIAGRHYNYAAATGLTFAATALSSVIQPVFGALTDRRNLRWLVPAGLTVAGVGIGLSGLAASYPLTGLAIALSGVGVAAFHPEAARAARAASGDSQQAMSVFSVGGNADFAIGPLFVVAVLAATGTRGTPLLALPALIAGVAVYAVLRHDGHTTASERPGERRAAGPDDWAGFALLTSAVIVRSIFFFGLSSLLALYVGTGLHGGRQLGEAALTTMLIAGAIGTITGGRLADRFGRLPVIRGSFAVTAAGLAAIVLAGLPWVFGAIALTGFALNQSFSLTVTLGQDYLPTRIGTSSGVTLGLAISIGGLATPALGALADATSLHLAVTVLTAFPLIGLGLALRLRRPRRECTPPGRHAVQLRTASLNRPGGDTLVFATRGAGAGVKPARGKWLRPRAGPRLRQWLAPSGRRSDAWPASCPPGWPRSGPARRPSVASRLLSRRRRLPPGPGLAPERRCRRSAAVPPGRA